MDILLKFHEILQKSKGKTVGIPFKNYKSSMEFVIGIPIENSVGFPFKSYESFIEFPIGIPMEILCGFHLKIIIKVSWNLQLKFPWKFCGYSN